MEYRRLKKGVENISIIGMGTSSIGAAGEKEARETMALALENGINYFDMASADAVPFPAFGNEIGSRRKDIYFQIHFGADYHTGSYGWTTDPDQIRRSVDWQLNALKTDYIDFGFLHCIDEENDFRKIRENGVFSRIEELKKQGIVRHIGFSSHTPKVACEILDTGVIDMMMFSINPSYDYSHGEYGIGKADERMDLYRRCEREGIGISVMKAFSGGQLLSADTSPFRCALTKYQCIQYALDKPGVLTVLPGVRNKEDLKDVLGYLNASVEEKDYSVIGSFASKEAVGNCVYCNHCQPCPAGLNVGLINKYYDLAKSGDELAKDHYRKLEKQAGDCIRCGHCEKRCPFHVDQVRKMEEIRRYFTEK